MIKPLKDYCNKEAFPRRCEILLGSEFIIALAIGLILGLNVQHTNFSEIKIAGVAGSLLNYAAIAFGFAVTGMTLALSIPDRGLVQKMSKTTTRKDEISTYSDLVFVFSWTALAHLLLIVFCIVMIFVFPENATLAGKPISSLDRALLGFLVGLIAYCVMQFLITIVTISQVASVYISELRK